MIYESKIQNGDNDEIKRFKISKRRLGISYIVIGSITTIFILVMEII